MKATKIIYWICTIVIVGFMLFSAVGTFLIHTPDSAEMLKRIQMPEYIMKFLAVCKILGAIAILIPGYPRLKEWAYAGYFFDLLGASYCMMEGGYPVAQWASIFIFIAILFGSYFTYHKKLSAAGAK